MRSATWHFPRRWRPRRRASTSVWGCSWPRSRWARDGAAGRRSFEGGGEIASSQPADDTAIGAIFTFILALGLFFLTLFSMSSAGGSGIQAARTLFGSIFGLGAGEARLAAVVGLGAMLGTLAIARPLLPRRSPRRWPARAVCPRGLLGVGFLALLGAWPPRRRRQWARFCCSGC